MTHTIQPVDCFKIDLLPPIRRCHSESSVAGRIGKFLARLCQWRTTDLKLFAVGSVHECPSLPLLNGSPVYTDGKFDRWVAENHADLSVSGEGLEANDEQDL